MIEGRFSVFEVWCIECNIHASTSPVLVARFDTFEEAAQSVIDWHEERYWGEYHRFMFDQVTGRVSTPQRPKEDEQRDAGLPAHEWK